MVVFEQKWLYSCKNDCNKIKGGIIRKKVVIIVQSGSVRTKVVVSGQ